MDTRAIEAAVAAGVMRFPASIMKLVAGPARVIDGCTLDQQSQFLLHLLERAGQPGFGDLDVESTRDQFDAAGGGLGPGARMMASVSDRTASGPSAPVPVRVYAPVAAPCGLPAVVYYHGGGWVVGSVETHDDVCRAIAEMAECVVVSVDYRLAPEHKFPAAADDAETAFDWVIAEAESLGIDARRVAVVGDSAGGNLAAVVAQTRATASIPPCFQLLIYPVTDLACDTPSYEKFADGFFLTKAGMLWFIGHYLADQAAVDDPRASPLRCEDLHSVPEACIFTAGFDPLRDEGRAYAEKLAAAGVAVSHRCYSGTIHGCLSLSGVLPQGAAMLSDAVGALRLAFARL